MTDTIFILNKAESVVDVLSNNGDSPKNPFFDDKYIQDLNTGAETFEFTTVSNYRTNKHLVAGCYVAFKYNNKIKMFQVIETNEDHEEYLYKTCYCEVAGLELINSVVRSREIVSANIIQFMENILADTEWKLGIVDAGITDVHTINIDKVNSIYNIIQHNLDKYNIEIEYRIAMSNNKVSGKYIDVYRKRGRVTRKRFEYGVNVSGVSKTEDMSELCTALIGTGANNIDFKPVEGEYPIIKPLNQDFVADEEAYKQWNKKGSHITGTFESSTDSPYELLQLTWNELQRRKQPKFTYDIKTEMIKGVEDEINIGDTVYVIDNDYTPALHLSARVGKLEISFTDHTKNKCILTNFKDVKSGVLSLDTIQAIIDGRFPIGSDSIQDGAITDGKIDIQYLTTIKTDVLIAAKVEAEELVADKATIADLTVANGRIDNLVAEDVKINGKLTVANADIDNLQADLASIDTLLAGNITAVNIKAGTITAGSSIVANGAIGSAQISSLDAGKVNAGTIDTSKVTVSGPNNNLKILGNRLQVFTGTGTGQFERVALGDVNGDGSVYGFRVRGADGTTVLLDENGVKREGLTDGSITNAKIDANANIDGAKINIASVVTKINAGTTSIASTKIDVGGTSLSAKLSTMDTTQTNQGQTITDHSARITANESAINLKVDSQTYTDDKTNMTNSISKNSADIGLLNNEIALKVEQTDITTAIDASNAATDTKIATAKADIKITTDSIAQRVSSTEATTTTLTINVNKAQTDATNAQTSANIANNALTINQQTKLNGIELFNNEFKSNVDAKPFASGVYSIVPATDIAGADANGSNLIKVVNGQLLYTDFISCNINNPYYASMNVYNLDTNNGTFYIQVGYYDKNKVALASNEAALNAIASVAIPSANVWHFLEGWVAPPASTDIRRKAKYVRIRVINRYSSQAGITYYKDINWKQLGAGIIADTQELKTEVVSTTSRVSTVETNLTSITSRVSSAETKQTTTDGKVSTLETKMSSAELKITDSAIAQTVQRTRSAQIYKVRYIRDHLNGSTANTGNHWVEIKAIDTRGLNMASGLRTDNGEIIGSSTIGYSTNANPYTLTDGTIDDNYCSTSVSGSTAYIQVDLGMAYSNIENIIVWHYHADGRTYHKTKTEVSEDGITWYTIFDSAIEREYVETKNGHSMVVNRGASSRTGIATLDDKGFRVENSDSNTYTLMDSGSFSVNGNTGGTIAEFSNNSIIPNLTSDGVISGNIIYANNVASKSLSNTNVRFIYVDGATGSDSNSGTSTSRLKTVQHAIDYMLEDIINDNVTIYVYNSVPGFSLLGKSGSGIITFSLQDSAIISGQVVVSGVYNALNFTNETGSRKSTLKGGLIVYRCRQVDIYALTFRGVNGNSCNIWVKQSNYVAVNTCDLGGLGTILNSAIIVESSTIWTHNLIGSNIRDVVCQYAFSIACIAKYGSITVPDYTTAYHSGYDSQGRYQTMTGASVVKTPSAGWNPAYTPSARTTTWTFNKIWSDETLKGWSDKQELIQGYSSTWSTGRYTGYMQMNDGFASIRDTIAGGTNLSGKVYVQRRTTSGNSTGSTLHLYASDGTHYTATINQGQGVWVNIDSVMVTKIMNGTVTYFYLRADADNPATYFKCESNAQIQITYTK